MNYEIYTYKIKIFLLLNNDYGKLIAKREKDAFILY